MLNNFYLDIELPKSSPKTVLNITETDLVENQDKVLTTLQKECIDLNSWFYIILYYYSKGDYLSFEKFSKELSKIDIMQNPFYKGQKILFINIINIISLFYSFIAYRSKDKESFESYTKLSTSLSNKADSLQLYHPITIIITALFLFIQGDYENSERNFSSFSEHGSEKNTNIVILSKLGRALIAYNQGRYEKAIEFFASLVKEYNYVNENILESLGICYYKANKVQKAKEIFEATLSQYPNNYKIKTYLAIIKLSFLSDDKNNSFNKAFEELMAAYKMNDYNDNTIPALLVNLCNIFLISGKFEEAGILCQKLNSQLEYGEIKFNSETSIQKNKAIRGYNEIRSAILVINAKYELSINKKKEAYIKFLSSVKENPKNIEAQFGLGRMYLLTNNLSEAENCFMECKKILDENKWVSFKILKYYGYVISVTKYKPKDIEKAIELFKQAIDIKKDDIDCYIKLGELLNLREPENSLKYYMKAVELIKARRIKEKKDRKKEIENINIDKNKLTDEPSIYSDDILPELLNNIGCTLLLKKEYQEVEKYLNEAKNILKEELRKLNHKYKNKDNKDDKDKKDNKDNKDNEDDKDKKDNKDNKAIEEKIDKIDKKRMLRFKSLKISVDFNLALFYDSQAQFDLSHFLYKKIIAENPYFIEAYIKLSELYKIRGNKVKSESYIKLAIDKHYKIIQDERKIQKEEVGKNSEKKNNEMIIEEEKKESKDIKTMNKESTENIIEEKKKEDNTHKKEGEKSEHKKSHRLITVMGKPINPMIIQANYLYENGKEYEAIALLNKILVEYKPYDPYTLTFLANIYYSMSIDLRTKNMDKEKMKKAIELYFRALEYDKYNALAAVGLSNCLCEFNCVEKALDVYRSVMEKFPNEYNTLINSSLIYMDDKKYEKAYILLHKVLVSIFHGNNSKVENLLIKCCIDMKDFKSANQHIKNLIMKYPDNLIYQFNYGCLLYSQFADIINKSTRKYADTEKAIKLVSRALNIFEELNKTKKDEINDKIIQKNEFYYKCNEMQNICMSNLTQAKDMLKKDLENEENQKKKNEEDLYEYKKKIEEKELKEKEIQLKAQEMNSQDEKIKNENMLIMDKINKKNIELMLEKKNNQKGKTKRGRKKDKKEYEEEDEYQNMDLEEKEYEESNVPEDQDQEQEDNGVNSDYYDEEEQNKKTKKKLLKKKRKFSDEEDDNFDDKENENKDNQENKENENEENKKEEMDIEKKEENNEENKEQNKEEEDNKEDKENKEKKKKKKNEEKKEENETNMEKENNENNKINKHIIDDEEE